MLIYFFQVKFSFGSAVGDSRIVSKIHFSSLHQDSLTTGEVPHIGNQPREEAINSTGKHELIDCMKRLDPKNLAFLVTFTCASTGITSTTFIFNITGNSSQGTCETTGRISLQKSCLGENNVDQNA